MTDGNNKITTSANFSPLFSLFHKTFYFYIIYEFILCILIEKHNIIFVKHKTAFKIETWIWT